MPASRFAGSVVLAGCLLSLAAAPAAAEPPAMIAAPAPTGPSWADYAFDAGLVTLASAVVIAGMAWDAGQGPVGRFGSLGQAAMIAVAVAAPPAALVAIRKEPFDGGAYMAALPAGAIGLALGMAVARPIVGTEPHPALSSQVLGFGSAALMQGLGAATGFSLYENYRSLATDLDRLPATRLDDPIENWDLKRERQQRQ